MHIFDETIPFEEFPICSLWGSHLFIGGLWGGKIFKYDILGNDPALHGKHSDTVTAMGGS